MAKTNTLLENNCYYSPSLKKEAKIMLENQVEVEYHPIHFVLIKLRILWVKTDFINNFQV